MVFSISLTKTSTTSLDGESEVNFLMNDCSIHGQFHTTDEFFDAVETLMEIRSEIKRVGSELFCHRDIAHARVTTDVTMPQAIQGMPPEKQRAWIQWLTKHGPYWGDVRQHGKDDWLETGDGQLVTDTAIGEAAFCLLHSLSCELVSIDPSDWLQNPITVTWKKDDKTDHTADITNHWALDTVSQSLEQSPPCFDSWNSLEEHIRRACDRLTFSDDAFAPLKGHPFVHGAAERIQILHDMLHKIRGCFDDNGNRTAEGSRIFTDHFTGDNAWFSDSSETEINDFKSELTFPHPERPNEYLLCSWHGKVKTSQLRIHFSQPVSANVPFYVVYVGPKITKR